MGHRPQIYHSSGYRVDQSIRPYFLHGPMRTIMLIIIHCPATPQGMSLSFEDCRRGHIFYRSFCDIGYHFYLIRDGEIRRGRPLDKIGAHCQGHNKRSIGTCYEGGLDSNHELSDTHTLPQKASLVILLCELKRMFSNVLVVGHHDSNSMKECPCFSVVAEYRGF